MVGYGMRAHRRAQDVVGRLDVRDPVAHGLVDGVLERRRARGHAAHLGTERAHPQDVGPLALDVLGAHVHDARQVQQGAGRGRRDAVLAGAGLGDDPGLAEPPGQQRLAEGVVDLVRTGVGEVLALEVEAEPRDGDRGGASRRGRRTGRRRGKPGRFAFHGGGQAIGPVQRRGSAGEALQQVAQVRPEHRVVAQRVVRGLELGEGRHQRLGHVATTEVALHAPAAGGVGVEQAGVDRRRAERGRWAGRRGRPWPASRTGRP